MFEYNLHIVIGTPSVSLGYRPIFLGLQSCGMCARVHFDAVSLQLCDMLFLLDVMDCIFVFLDG